MLTFTSLGTVIGFLPILDMTVSQISVHSCDAGDYHTWHRISPPTPSRRACRPVMTPRGVVRMLIPRPPSTRGTSARPTYTRQPGFETRSTLVIAASLLLLYFK